MKVGDLIKAKWPDGYQAVGRYTEAAQGYIILLGIGEENEKIVCDPNCVEFEVLNEAARIVS
jgi:hypothetical protein